MKPFWILHLIGALACGALAVLFYLPDQKLPKSLVQPRSHLREQITWPIACRLFPENLRLEDTARLNRQIVKEKCEDQIQRLKAKRKELQENLQPRPQQPRPEQERSL